MATTPQSSPGRAVGSIVVHSGARWTWSANKEVFIVTLHSLIQSMCCMSDSASPWKYKRQFLSLVKLEILQVRQFRPIIINKCYG